MVGRLFTNEATNAALVVVLSGTVATLAARGAGGGRPGRGLSPVLSNPVPRHTAPGTRARPRSPAGRRRAAA